MDMSFYWTIGNNVRKFRMENGMTQEELAEKAHLSTKGIQKVEGGRSGIRMETFIRIAIALDVSLDELAEIQERDEKRKIQEKAFYLLVENKSIEEITYAVEMINIMFQLKKEYLE